MIYEYACSDCNHVFEVVKRLAEIDRVEACPQCGSQETARKIFAPGFTTSESLGRVKAPGEFRDLLKTIHTRTPGSQMELD